MLDAAIGMLYLHSRATPVIHRDLKSPNLLVDENWRVKVTDFNLSRFLQDTVGSRNSSMAAMNPVSGDGAAGGIVATSDLECPCRAAPASNRTAAL